jgi:hypothetical protein
MPIIPSLECEQALYLQESSRAVSLPVDIVPTKHVDLFNVHEGLQMKSSLTRPEQLTYPVTGPMNREVLLRLQTELMRLLECGDIIEGIVYGQGKGVCILESVIIFSTSSH